MDHIAKHCLITFYFLDITATHTLVWSEDEERSVVIPFGCVMDMTLPLCHWMILSLLYQNSKNG